MQRVIMTNNLLPASVERVKNIFCPGAVIQWLAVTFGIPNEEIDILSSTARVVSDNSMSVHPMSYYKLKRGKNEESEGEGQDTRTIVACPCSTQWAAPPAPSAG